MSMCFFHKWGKWEEYKFNVPDRRISTKYMLAGGTEFRQRRICQKCHKLESQYIEFIKH